MDQKLERKLKYFYLTLNIRTEGFSFFIVVPFVLIYVWANIQLTPEQYAIFNNIWPPAFIFGIAVVLVNNWIVLIPVLRYFRKLINGVTASPEEYFKAKKRFLRLPYIHAAGAFFRWIILLGNAIIPTTFLADLNTPQWVNMWTGVAICSILGVFTYFSITEVMVQDILKRGIFPKKIELPAPPRLNILPRLTLMSISASLLTAATLFAFFYITVETTNIAGTVMYLKIAFLMILALIAGLITPFFINKTIRYKIDTVVRFLGQIGNGNLEAPQEEIAIEDEITMINHEVDDMRENLKTARDRLLEMNLTLEQKVADRTEELQAAMEEMEAMNENLLAANEELEDAERLRLKDLAMAATVQKAFLPEEPPNSGDYEIAFVFKPANLVSGDFYDFYYHEGKLQGTGIYDVSGHGISSGLLTLIARSTIQRSFSRGRNDKLNRVMEKINRELIEEIGQSDKYLTGIILRFQKDYIEYVNSGHPDAFFKIAGSNKVGKITNKKGESVKGMFLGVAAMENSYEVLNIKLNTDDILFIFSDCVLETVNSRGEHYGEDRIKAALAAAQGATSQEILDHLVLDLTAFARTSTSFTDDLTAMVIKKL